MPQPGQTWCHLRPPITGVLNFHPTGQIQPLMPHHPAHGPWPCMIDWACRSVQDPVQCMEPVEGPRALILAYRQRQHGAQGSTGQSQHAKPVRGGTGIQGPDSNKGPDCMEPNPDTCGQVPCHSFGQWDHNCPFRLTWSHRCLLFELYYPISDAPTSQYRRIGLNSNSRKSKSFYQFSYGACDRTQ